MKQCCGWYGAIETNQCARISGDRSVDLDREIALIAADLSFEPKLPMADSSILATARAHNATLWTQDEHFKDIEGVKYVEKKSEKEGSPVQWGFERSSLFSTIDF